MSSSQIINRNSPDKMGLISSLTSLLFPFQICFDPERHYCNFFRFSKIFTIFRNDFSRLWFTLAAGSPNFSLLTFDLTFSGMFCSLVQMRLKRLQNSSRVRQHLVLQFSMWAKSCWIYAQLRRNFFTSLRHKVKFYFKFLVHNLSIFN